MEFDGGLDREQDQAEALRLMGLLARVEGWPESDLEDGRDAVKRTPVDAAELFTEMLARHPHDSDDRSWCVDCKHYRYGHCRTHVRAGLHSPVVGRDLAEKRQKCNAFEHEPGLQAV